MDVRGVRAGAGVGAGEHEPALSCSPRRPTVLLPHVGEFLSQEVSCSILTWAVATPHTLTLLLAVCPGLELSFMVQNCPHVFC